MAMYNNGFPATYQPIYPSYTPIVQQQQPNVQPSVQGGINWIQGEQAAKSYLVAPNNSVVLFDSESQSIYIKSADASGMPSMKILDYTIRDPNKTPPNTAPAGAGDSCAEYATKSEIDGLNSEIKALRERVDSLTKRRNREVEE